MAEGASLDQVAGCIGGVPVGGEVAATVVFIRDRGGRNVLELTVR